MNAEILAVGSELLTPARADTNSLWLTAQLNDLGVEVVTKIIAGDERVRLAALFSASLDRSDLILITGGLGPTEDDVTRDAVAEALGRSQTFRQELCDAIAERFARMGRHMAENNTRQAYLIDGAEALPNDRGTAPGQWISLHGSKAVALLPGPPHELKAMFTQHCLARLRSLIPPLAIATRHYRVAGMGESDLDQLIAPVYTPYANPVTTILSTPGDVSIHLRARGETSAEADSLAAELGAKIEALLGERIYSTDGADLEATVGRLLRQSGATVAVAESCTGGLLGARFTSVSGSSDYFLGGFLTYTNAIKASLLGVDPGLLADHTAVSEPVAIAMANGVRDRTGAVYALSVTGYAEGPNSGEVFLGLATPESTTARQLRFLGDRARVRQLAATTALNMLRLHLLR